MNKSIINVKPDKHDTHIRLFSRVLGDSELTPLQKIILSDVISYQIQGKRYFKTSKALSKELGNISKKTIQANFQLLNQKGYLDCVPFKNSDDETNSLRQATVVNIDQWIADKETFNERKLGMTKREVKEKNHPTRMAWPNRHGKEKQSSTELLDAPEDNPIENTPVEVPQNDLPIVLYSQLNHNFEIRDEIRRQIRGGVEPRFFEALLDFEMGEELLQDTFVKVGDRSYPMQNHMRHFFIYDGWSPDDPINPEDELLDELENLD